MAPGCPQRSWDGGDRLGGAEELEDEAGGTKACQIKGRRVGRGEARGLRQGELASLILRSTSVSLTTLVFFSQLLPAFVP